MSRLRVAVDFDGVLHSYTSPWVSEDVIPDPPVPGAIEWLQEMLKEFDVFIHSTRCATNPGRSACLNWLDENGLQEALKLAFDGRLRFTNSKEPCVIYIDDRGYRFTGNNFPSADEIRKALPWWKQVAV
jgi:hypothetical protein